MKRRVPWSLTVLLSVALLALLAVSQITADFAHTTNVLLSEENAPCDAVKPEISTSADHSWIAVSWIQEKEKTGNECYDNLGHAMLRWATEQDAPDGWQGPLTVFDVNSNSCINDVNVALDNATAHLIATVQEPCVGTESSSVYYRTCNLQTEECAAQTIIYQENNVDVSGIRVLDVALTLDQSGNPHVVYNRIDATSTEPDWVRTSETWYTRQNTSDNWTRLKLGDNAYHPNITWSYSTIDDQGYVHVVWETHEYQSGNVSEFNGRAHYRRCPDDIENPGGTIDCDSNPDYNSTFIANTHPRPSIIADGDDITLFWNRCASFEPNPPCELLSLLYERSTTGGWSFADPKELRTNQNINYETQKYHGTDDESEEYTFSLRPAAVANNEGLPVVAWQVENPDYDGGYTITTTLVTSATENTLTWKETDWSEGNGYDLRVNPVVALPPSGQEAEGMHLVFMQSDGAYGTFQIYYSYFGTELFVEPTPTPTPGSEDNRTYVYLPLVMQSHP